MIQIPRPPKPKPPQAAKASAMDKLDQVTFSRQDLLKALKVFFDISGDHVGDRTFDADIERVWVAVEGAMSESRNASVGELEVRAEEILGEVDHSLTEAKGELVQDWTEHLLTAHEYGLSHRAA
jgi:hypothetical protein